MLEGKNPNVGYYYSMTFHRGEKKEEIKSKLVKWDCSTAKSTANYADVLS